jgi:hypothetical protein
VLVRSLALFAFASFVVGAGGCGLFGGEPKPCVSSSECDDTERCTRRVCTEFVPECAKDGDCEDGGICDVDTCVECVSDGDCSGTDVCEDNSCESGGPGPSEGEGDQPPPPPPPDPEAPRILNISSNVTSITENGVIRISVIVTDPQGIENVIGGNLFDPQNNATYGSFATSAAEGAYEIDVSWSEINTVRTISFITDAQRTLRARFFDVEGNESFGDVTVDLGCDGEPACQGRCAALDCGGTCETNLNGGFGASCGACGEVCDTGACSGGTPVLGYGATCSCEELPGVVEQCSGGCTSVSGGAAGCGACGKMCPAGDSCVQSNVGFGCACTSTSDCLATELCDTQIGACIPISQTLSVNAAGLITYTLRGTVFPVCANDMQFDLTEVPSLAAGVCPGATSWASVNLVDVPNTTTIGGFNCDSASLRQCSFTAYNCDVGVRATCGGASAEICDNGFDDDGDGFTDCNDNACFATAACNGGGGDDIRQTNGYLEVLVSGSFGQVCDDAFDTNDAIVACRQLGTPSNNPTISTDRTVPSSAFVLDDLGCNGSETRLQSCTSQPEDCGTSEGVFVTCN